MFGVESVGKGLSFVKVLSGLNKTLSIANQMIPIYQQAKPMIQNAKSAFRVLKEFTSTNSNQPTKATKEKSIRSNTSLESKKEKSVSQTSPTSTNQPVFFV